MSMTHDLLLLAYTLLILALLIPSSCLQNHPLSAPQGSMLMEDKIRLGSIPPSCHNRCNECNPCRPVQVPTMPTGKGSDPVRARTRTRPMLVDQPTFSQYSNGNYKPLGWKCRCGDRLFNP